MKKTPKNFGDGWIQEFPDEEGYYWFHGQRWSTQEELSTIFCKVAILGGKPMVYTMSDNHIYPGDVGEKWAFKKIKLEEPKIPKL